MKSVLVETAQFEESDGQTAEKPWFSQAITFNRDGQVTEEVNRNPDGSEWRTVNHYSDSGHLLATSSFDPSGAPNDEMKYLYADEDKLVAEQHITRDGRVTTPTTYAYDGMGAKVKIQKLDFHGEATVMIGIEGTSSFISADGAQRVESRYDDRGEVVEVKVFDMGVTLLSRVEITRDARGNPLEETQYFGDAPFGSCASDSCTAEEMVALTEEQKAEFAAEIARLFSPGTVMSKHTHTYDTEGRLIESKLTMMGMIEAARQTFAYDEVGNRSEEVSYNQDGTLGTKAVFAREYDEHGNWIKELVSNASSWDAEFGLSTPARVTRRVITYW